MRDRPQATTAPLAGSPCRGDRFPRSMQEPEPSSRHLHAGRHLASQQAPPRLIPGLQSIPGFDVTFVFRHVISGSLSLAFLTHTCRAQRRDFPATLTTTALNRSSSRWFAASACTAAAEGHQATTPGSSISCTAPHPDLVFYIQPPSTFVAHPRTTCKRAGGEGADNRNADRAGASRSEGGLLPIVQLESLDLDRRRDRSDGNPIDNSCGDIGRSAPRHCVAKACGNEGCIRLARYRWSSR